MELPDCPPGAEGYQDSVTEVPKKIESDETSACTKAEQEFQQHLNSLKIKTEDGNYRCMVERRGRDVSGKWIYLCYPCAAMCSGERILQTHISGKKHKTKLSIRSIWPLKIFDEHPYVSNSNSKSAATEKVLQKMAEEVEMFKKTPTELDMKYDKYREIRCHIQDTLDAVKAPLLGIEYLIEHPPEKAHHEPSYMCTLCSKQGHPRTIVNHLTCFWHRYNYMLRHFTAACAALTPFRAQAKYREGVAIIMNRLAQRVQDRYGRLRPAHLDKDDYEKDKDQIHQWIFRGHHFTEKENCTFEEVVDVDLITSLDSTKGPGASRHDREPSPPIVAAPSKPTFGSKRNTRRRGSMESLSDVSDEPEVRIIKEERVYKGRGEPPRYDPYAAHRRSSPRMDRPMLHSAVCRPPNYSYKVKLADEKRAAAEEAARRARDYHEKNPEKHPLYPDEWRKFWNRRYKEIQAEGKDPSKYDFKPEWIVYWTGRMKELHDDELKTTVLEIYRRLRLTPPETSERKRRSSERRKSLERRKSIERRRSPEHRRSTDRRPSYALKRHSPPKRSQDAYRRKSSERRDRRSPVRGRSPRRRTPLRYLRTRSRSPVHKESPRRRSPLSRRGSAPRNHSPTRAPPARAHTSLHTVLISDDELKNSDDGLSPWNSDDSLGSLPEAKSPVRRSVSTGVTHASRRNDYQKRDFDAENVVATLRLLVALEDYLGSLGPKIVDLLAEALKMEKDKANSSEEMLEKESALVLIETAKEKLKGAVQAGLVASGAAAAVRAAVVRAAATLHAADTRLRKKKQSQADKSCAVPVAGVGEVDRAQIAQQMAAALVAEGKTDVSSEELAQLVDAVVGMAEAKKREAAESKKSEARAANDRTTRPLPASGTTSALKMLQFAYDDKKVEREDNIPDVMDGLSDSDLETLLKNFNELSAEEQHSLIAYLKKLEAREPQRVERLRQYVSAAATTTLVESGVKKVGNIETVAVESDDDDYTVEDVFKSATQKVKEDQIRQEMEIVKKSLEETKDTNSTLNSPSSTAGSNLLNISSATNLLALVQATLQSTPASTPAISQITSDVVMSSTHPRSFGDLPESVKPLLQLPLMPFNKQTPFNEQNKSQNSPSETNSNVNQININKPLITTWEQRQDNQPILDRSNMQNIEKIDTERLRGSQNNYQGNRNQDNIYYQRVQQDQNIMPSRGNYSQGQQNTYNQGSQGHQTGLIQGPLSLLNDYNQMVQGDKYSQSSQRNFNQETVSVNFNRGPQENYKQGMHGDNFNQDLQGNCNQISQGENSQGSQGSYNQGLQGDNYSQGSQGSCNQGSQGDNYSQTSQGSYNQGSLGDNYSQGSQGSYNQGSQGDNYSQGPQGNYNRGRGQGNNNQGIGENQINFNQGGRPFDNNSSGLRVLMDNYNSIRGGTNNSRGSNNFNNQGSRGNYMGNNRSQDSFNIRNTDQQNQHFGNNQKQNNFRGRGRGYGSQRGRGRGFY